VLAPDIVGFGATDRPDDVVYSLRTWTNHVWAFLDAHGIEKTAIVGNSLGGRIALQMATDRPDRITKMVLMGAPGVGMALTDGLAALRAYQPSHDAMRDLLRTYFAVDPTMITDDLVAIRYEASIAGGAYEAYRTMFFDPRHSGSELGITEDEVRAIATPALLVHGREDKVVPMQVSVRSARVQRLRTLDPDRARRRVLRAGLRVSGPVMSTGVQARRLQEAAAAAQLPMVDDDVAAQRFRVHRSAMTSPRVHRAEIERIFAKSWLYVGHESEIPNPGDFVRRPVGGRPLFMVRGAKTGNVNVFHNTCTHRGALVCRQESGNSKVFQCFYHAWTFDTEGNLKGVPGRDAYAGGVNFDELGLQRVARVESYRGFVFASFDPGIVDLNPYLAGAKDYIDLVVDGCGGSVEMVRGSNQYSFNANWKLLVENSIDGYHAESTHDTYFKYLVSIGTDLRGGVSGRAIDLGNGHAVIEYSSPWGRPVAKWEPLFGEDARTEIDRLRADLVSRHGEERAHTMAEVNRNMLIYPNLIINDIMAVTVRTFYPPAPDVVDVTAWELAPTNEAPSLRERRLDSFLTFLGPGGFATPDDLEALESCQQGFVSGGVEWNDISRGMGRSPLANDEEQMRAFWRRWQHQMGAAADLAGAQ
jgi:p-cumate 2,3-dioxygenase alpha subunit